MLQAYSWDPVSPSCSQSWVRVVLWCQRLLWLSSLTSWCTLTRRHLHCPDLQVGIQEKCTFIQLLQKPNVYSAVLRLPAVLQLLLAATAMAVLFHHAPPAAPAPKPEVETVEARGGHFSESEPLNLHHDA